MKKKNIKLNNEEKDILQTYGNDEFETIPNLKNEIN